MSKHNKKTARLLQGVTLGLIIIATTLFWGCENPVGGAEQKPLEQLVGKVYQSEWGELFHIISADTIKLGSNSELGISYFLEGKIKYSMKAAEGTVYLLECDSHSNWSPSQYPSYTEDNPHKNCYFPLYIRFSSMQLLEWAQFYQLIEEDNEEKATTCFASTSLEMAQKYLDYNNWTPPMTSTGIAQN